ncbi:putative carboxypeptidase [Thiovulum sp. ES]|nr:putative carboxypeptidase [Thiovulum sp. ES]
MKRQYYSYDETLQFFRQKAEEFPNLLSVSVIGKTHENRDIILATLSLDVATADTKPALLYTGTIHAREWIGNELSIKFVDYILQNYQFDPRLEKSLQNSALYIVPTLNPDGFEYSRKHFSFWRKNRRKNSDGSYGVDLNRNFGIGFTKTKDKSSNIYGGEEAFSEPETSAIRDFVESHQNITIALDYHSQGNVFFPAHKFRHEAEIDGSDLNILCANMNHEIKKVSGRTYGIHRGKPPTHLISGSGREFYYSRGILATVVEVGTKNIPDYAKSMTESINENIPALLKAFSETINYSKLAPKRVDNFSIAKVESKEITFSWNYEVRDDIYFEIYRNRRDKEACEESTRIGMTKVTTFTDVQLESGTLYFYTIRVVNLKTKIKSPFAPVVRVTTLLQNDEFSKKLFPIKNEIGYISQKSEDNQKHFGLNSLFVGVNQNKGVSISLLSFSVQALPENAKVVSASLFLYPMNRVGAKIEKYGEWNISLLNIDTITDIYNFDEVEKAETLAVVGDALKSENLTQGIWNSWDFSYLESKIFQKALSKGKVVFKLEGPKTLPLGEDSQMMQFDIGYGQFGGGLEYRPYLDIKYKIPSNEMAIEPNRTSTISRSSFEDNKISVGFDGNGDRIYGLVEFDVAESLPNPETTVITEAHVEIKARGTMQNREDIRFYLELVDIENIEDYDSILHREKIDFIGYEVSNLDIGEGSKKFFIFDSNLRKKLDEFHSKESHIKIIIRASSPNDDTKKMRMSWVEPKLVLKYIERRKKPISPVSNLSTSVENGMIKLSWENPKDEDFSGCYVVRNSFHPPKNFSDGVKLYGGTDNFTYDNFGSLDRSKYYAVFTYDNVPNFSEPKIIYYYSS